jgi:RND family efflux transporter MFP subunit
MTMGEPRASQPAVDPDALRSHEPATRDLTRRRLHLVPVLVTLMAVAVAVPLGRAMWVTYFEAPWTRDGTVRVYVVTIAPQVAGRIVELPVVDNQLVRRGDLLMEIDPTDYRIAVHLAEASATQAEVDAQNAEREAKRREPLAGSAISTEQQQVYDTKAASSRARHQEALATLEQARVNLERTQIHSPVNGWVTNLQARLGDYVNVGRNEISVIDADSFWLDAYFEETKLAAIRKGDPARIKLLGFSQVLRGHVGSIARGINVPNAQSDQQGIATVNPIFTWVRLAQRIPVRVEFDQVPEGVELVAGMTATVEVDPRPR